MSYWSYAIINGRLGEIYFDRKKGRIIYEGHTYLHPNEHLTLREAAALQHDVWHTHLSYYRKKYRHLT